MTTKPIARTESHITVESVRAQIDCIFVIKRSHESFCM